LVLTNKILPKVTHRFRTPYLSQTETAVVLTHIAAKEIQLLKLRCSMLTHIAAKKIQLLKLRCSILKLRLKNIELSKGVKGKTFYGLLNGSKPFIVPTHEFFLLNKMLEIYQ